MSGGTVVIGGGVAGITATLALADAGAEVTLLEVRPRLGGAAYSFERDGLLLDNGQHVFLRCCEHYRALLRRLGSEHLTRVQKRLEIPILSPGLPPAVLRRSGLPAPLHLAGALLRYPHLPLRARAGAARAALGLARLDLDDPSLDRRTLGAWLAEHGQGPETHAPLWDLIALPTLNLPAAEASLALGAFVFQRGLLADAAAGDIGFHQAPLSRIIDLPARAALDRAGVEVRLGWRAQAVRVAPGGFTVEGPEERIEAAAVIVALPAGRAQELLPDAALDPRRRPGALAAAPIVNVHVFYDRPVWDLPFAAGVKTPVQYIFDRSESNGIERGRYLAISLSGARAEMAMPPAEVRDRYVAALRALLPAACGARVERVELSREHAATFAAVPGAQGRRPAERTRIPGLALAGAYTATGWPATLESAAISGARAASAALEHLGAPPGAHPANAAPHSPPPLAAAEGVDEQHQDRARHGGSPMSELLVATPLSLERLAVRAARRPVEVVRTGIGPRRSEQALPRLTAAPARALAVVGFCGALDDTLRPGELVVAGELRDPEGGVIACPGAEALVDQLVRAGLRARVGTIASARRLVVGDARGRLAAAGAIAVDMESAWLAPAAVGRPFAVVRVVVDTPDREVHRPLATVNGVLRACAVLRRAVRPLEVWARTASSGATVERI